MDTPFWAKSDEVYEPSEDTFLFLDCLSRDLQLIKSKRPTICLEIGAGTGVLTTALCRNLGVNVIYLVTDINNVAAEVCQETFRINKVPQNLPQVIISDLFSCFGDSLKGKVDLLLFNPPYVPTDEDELSTGDILSKSWAGGEDGRVVIDRFIQVASKFLSDTSFMYILLVKENKPEEVIQMLEKASMAFEEVVIQRKCKNEQLMVLRFRKV